MSLTQLEVVYDGPALQNGSMEVSDFAPALLGVAEACQRAHAVLNPDSAPLSVKARADLKRGSFHVDLDLGQVALVGSALFAGLHRLHDAKDIVDTLFSGDHSVAGIIKSLRGRDPRTVTPDPAVEPGSVSITVGANSTLVIGPEAWDLVNDPVVRRSLQKAVAPLQQHGIDDVTIGSDERKTIIRKQDAPAFAELPRERVIDEERRELLEIVSFDFDRGKSRFTDGAAVFSADIVDEVFWKKIDERVYRPGKGDCFLVHLAIKRSRGIRLRSDYRIVEVLDLIPPERRLIEEADDDDASSAAGED